MERAQEISEVFCHKSYKTCEKCNKLIDHTAVQDTCKDYLTNREKTVYFHIDCFEPKFSIPVRLDSITSSSLKQKMEKFNTQFIPPNISKLTESHFTLKTQPKVSRAWIEILKFLSVKDLLKIGEVSKSLYMHSRMAEIWFNITKVPGSTGKDIIKNYVSDKFGRCVDCRSENDLVFCIVLRRPFCSKCYKNVFKFRGLKYKFDLRRVTDLMKQYRLSWNFFENLRVCYDKNFQLRTFPVLVEEALGKSGLNSTPECKLRKRRKLREESNI